MLVLATATKISAGSKAAGTAFVSCKHGYSSRIPKPETTQSWQHIPHKPEVVGYVKFNLKEVKMSGICKCTNTPFEDAIASKCIITSNYTKYMFFKSPNAFNASGPKILAQATHAQRHFVGHSAPLRCGELPSAPKGSVPSKA